MLGTVACLRNASGTPVADAGPGEAARTVTVPVAKAPMGHAPGPAAASTASDSGRQIKICGRVSVRSGPLLAVRTGEALGES